MDKRVEHGEIGLVARLSACNKAIGEPVRMKMVKILGSTEPCSMNVSAIARALGLSQPAATKHLQIMENVGFFDRERHGTSVFYSLNREALYEYRELMELAFERVEAPCPHEYDCRTCPHADTCV